MVLVYVCMCDDYTVPMPVSGGCPTFVAMMGAAFAPIAVTGGVSILACREGERVDETEGMTVQAAHLHGPSDSSTAQHNESCH